jgi:DNA-binding CsgD family transcriptional regulator
MLTPRELEVAELVAEGHTNESISHQLGNSIETVKNQLAQVFRKTGCTSRVDLAVRVWKQRHAAEVAKIHDHYLSIDTQSH